jgi:hypothetical protein
MSTRIKHIRERNTFAQMQIAYGLWPIEDQIRYAGYSVEDVSFLLEILAVQTVAPLPEDAN